MDPEKVNSEIVYFDVAGSKVTWKVSNIIYFQLNAGQNHG